MKFSFQRGGQKVRFGINQGSKSQCILDCCIDFIYKTHIQNRIIKNFRIATTEAIPSTRLFRGALCDYTDHILMKSMLLQIQKNTTV